MRTLTFPRENYIPRDARHSVLKVTHKETGAVCFAYRAGNLFGLCAFAPKSQKPTLHYTFRREAARDQRARDFFAAMTARKTSVEARRADRKAPHKLQLGHILKSSWGYDQTNVDFYEVTRLVSATMVEIRKIAQSSTSTGDMTGTCLPVAGDYLGPPMRKRVSHGGVRITSFASAFVWSGAPASWSSYA